MADSAYAAPQARAPRPFRRSGLAGRAWPFCAPLTFVLVAVLADHARGRAAGRELFGVALMVATVALTAVIPWERLPRRADAIPPLTVIVAVSLLRSATMVPQSVWAPVMLLVVPKQHMIQDELWEGLISKAGPIAVQLGDKYSPGGFRLVSNFGYDAMQSQEHAHIHVVGGMRLGEYA